MYSAYTSCTLPCTNTTLRVWWKSNRYRNDPSCWKIFRFENILAVRGRLCVAQAETCETMRRICVVLVKPKEKMYVTRGKRETILRTGRKPHSFHVALKGWDDCPLKYFPPPPTTPHPTLPHDLHFSLWQWWWHSEEMKVTPYTPLPPLPTPGQYWNNDPALHLLLLSANGQCTCTASCCNRLFSYGQAVHQHQEAVLKTF